MNYAIATFCYGDRYYQQCNRMIESFDCLEIKPHIFIVTDSPESILERDFVSVSHIDNFNTRYSKYSVDYYNFDFSVKMVSLQYAFENGYENVILTDCDVVVNELQYSHDIIINTFIPNSISGPVTYNHTEQFGSNSMLGNRLSFYEDIFDYVIDKSELNQMVEDCIMFINIPKEKQVRFISQWKQCVEVKKNHNLPNIPAGNIDEISFSAHICNIKNRNNSHLSINQLVAKHNKWYI